MDPRLAWHRAAPNLCSSASTRSGRTGSGATAMRPHRHPCSTRSPGAVSASRRQPPLRRSRFRPMRRSSPGRSRVPRRARQRRFLPRRRPADARRDVEGTRLPHWRVRRGVRLDRRWGVGQGFDNYFDDFDLSRYDMSVGLDAAQRPGHEVVDRALAWLGTGAGPFFAWVHLYEPHSPYTPPSRTARASRRRWREVRRRDRDGRRGGRAAAGLPRRSRRPRQHRRHRRWRSRRVAR